MLVQEVSADHYNRPVASLFASLYRIKSDIPNLTLLHFSSV